MWFSTEIGADFIRGESGESDRVVAHFRKWVITLDTLSVAVPGGASATYTRMMAAYVNGDGLRFRVRRRRIHYGIAKKFPGTRSIVIGDPEFDRRFIVKGNSESKIRILLASPRIRHLIQSQPSIDLEVRHGRDGTEPSLPDGVDQLYFHEDGIITDVKRLKSLYDLFAEILDRLYRTGFASRDKPGFVL